MNRNRSVATCIILSIITCGLYGIYWFICLVDDVKFATNDQSLPSGGVAFLLTIVTCGLYSYYLWYKLGKALYDNGVSAADNSVMYLIIALIFPIINYCLVQSELNANS